MSKLVLDDLTVELVAEGKTYTAALEGHTYRLEEVDLNGSELRLLMDGRPVTAFVSANGPNRWVTVEGRTYLLHKAAANRARHAGHDNSSELIAPMPGQVRAVNTKAGDTVTKGQVLVVLEAMKMEIRLQAPYDATVAFVDAQVAQTVERDQILVKLQQA